MRRLGSLHDVFIVLDGSFILNARLVQIEYYRQCTNWNTHTIAFRCHFTTQPTERTSIFVHVDRGSHPLYRTCYILRERFILFSRRSERMSRHITVSQIDLEQSEEISIRRDRDHCF